ncbi:hypothetical protein G4X40_11640 [Rhodococcus sp. D2-41]|uniref:hypothetical protein n=1 Tax=Speluncibacter jeojiensis TaxID=2710754 RepID=UPI0024105C6A|nr:hypothetical protein [Rhodococcus sp. D2-41]MDG3010801.1 hypothetical protein [Rhodococcus sp. D2-41]
MAANTAEPGRLWVPRRRGAVGGLLLMLLGAWGAIVPFVGPYFDFTYGPASTWSWTAARGWFEVAPGAAAFLGGLMLLLTSSRAVAMAGAWLAVAGGVWFVIGPAFAPWLTPGELGAPGDPRAGMSALEQIGYFSGVGVAIALLGGISLGRLSALTVRDAQAAQARRQRATTTATDRRHRGLFPHSHAHAHAAGPAVGG